MKIKNLFSFKTLHKFENSGAFLAVLLLALFPTIEVVARIFRTGVPNSTIYTHHLVLVVTFIGAMITAREKKHLSMALDIKIKEPFNTAITSINGFLAAMFSTAFAVNSFAFALMAFTGDEKVGIFPSRLVAMVLFLGFAVMAIRFIIAVPARGKGRLLAAMGIIYGFFLSFDALVQAAGSLRGVLQFGKCVYYFTGYHPADNVRRIRAAYFHRSRRYRLHTFCPHGRTPDSYSQRSLLHAD